MATERDLELLDDYMANRLSGSEKSLFEQRLQADPDLRNEYSFQQQLVRGIKSARTKELKSLLNNTPVPSSYNGGSTSVAAKLAIGTLIIGVIGTGLYLSLDRREDNKIPGSEETLQPLSPEEPEQKENTSGEEPAGSTPTITNENPGQDEQITTRKKDNAPVEQKPVEQPVINVFDPTEDAKAEEAVSAADESPRTSASQPASTVAVEIEKNNRNYPFHYQFREGNLFLYGPFEKNLYEILEFFSEDKRTVFLYYKDSYYLLGEESDKIKPLTPVTDTRLINRLKEYRKN